MHDKQGETMKFEYAILGQGAAAFAAAIRANELGIKTAMVGGSRTPGARLGGTCVNVGCVPSKELIMQGRFINELSLRESIISYKLKPGYFETSMSEKDALVEKMRADKYEKVLDSLENVTYVEGLASFKGGDTIATKNEEITAGKFLIATGARAAIPKIKGIEGLRYLTNEEALSLNALPESLLVVGSGALGLEFAQMFLHFGSKVTLLQRSDRILSAWEPEIGAFLKGYLEEEGMDIRTGMEIKEVGEEDGQKYIRAVGNGKESVFRAGEILLATGRAPNSDMLDLGAVKVDTDNGFIKVSKTLQTTNGNIYAAGDVTGPPMLETLAAKEGYIATSNIFAGAKKEVNINEVPQAVFTSPEAASVGLTDRAANGLGIKCSCNFIRLSVVAKANIIKDTRGIVKIVIDHKTKRVLGVHILASNAADLIHEGTMAVKFGMTIDDIIDMVHVFPTMSESIKLAAQNFYGDVSKLSCCSI